jgi:hypothetical protein
MLLAFLLVPINAYWVLMCEVVRYAGHPTTISLFYNVVFWLCLLSLGNALVRSVLPRAALNRSELLGLYVLLGITSGLGGHDTAEVMLPILAYPAHFANSANNWAQTLLPNLPPWLAITDKEPLESFYAGHDSIWRAGQCAPGQCLCCAGALLTTLVWVMLCLNVLLRQRWTSEERLEFPLVQLPLALTEPGATLMRQKGSGSAYSSRWYCRGGTVSLPLPGRSHAADQVPGCRHDLLAASLERGGVDTHRVLPVAVALGILLPLDMSFSSWFFFLFWKGQSVASTALGLNQIPGLPVYGRSVSGAYLGIAAGALWGVRKHLSRPFRRRSS